MDDAQAHESFAGSGNAGEEQQSFRTSGRSFVNDAADFSNRRISCCARGESCAGCQN